MLRKSLDPALETGGDAQHVVVEDISDPARGWRGLFTSPGLLVSFGIHTSLLLVAGLVYIERHLAMDCSSCPVIVREPISVATIDPGPQEDPVGKHQAPLPPDPNHPEPEDWQRFMFFPDAKLSNHIETEGDKLLHQAKGESLNFFSRQAGDAGGIRGARPGKDKGVYDVIGLGIGGGGAGRYGFRHDGWENLTTGGNNPYGTPRTVIRKAIVCALHWLTRHQNSDGSWSVRGFERNCSRYGFTGQCVPNRFEGNSGFDTGVTGLALLAFLGAGYTPASHEKVFAGVPDSPTYGQVVKQGVKYLLSIQNAEGLISGPSDKYMYNHAIAALALCEAYGMTALPELQDPAQRAVDYLIKAKTPGAGWRYASGCGDTDSSVTGWAIMVLKSAELADIRFDKSAYQDVRKYYDDVTGQVPPDRVASKPRGGGTGTKDLTLTGYKGRDDAGQLVVVPGVNDQYEYNPALTAIMVMSRVFIDHKLTDKASSAVDTLFGYMPQKWSPDDSASWKACDFYYWYYASYAMFQLTRDDRDPRWTKWNGAMQSALLPTQAMAPKHARQCKEGSWEPVDRWSCEGGRVYTTAMGALTLEVTFRYPRILKDNRAGQENRGGTEQKGMEGR